MSEKNISRRQLMKLTGAMAAATTLPVTAASPSQAKLSGQTNMVFRGANLIPLTNGTRSTRGDLWIKDGKIAGIGENVTAPGATEVNAQGKTIIPGFIDTHHHMWQGSFRNTGPDDMLNDYFQNFLVPSSPKMTEEDVYLGNKLAAVAALNAGITQTLDWSHIANSPGHADAAIAALKETGTRAVYAYGSSLNFQGPGENPYPMDIFRLRREHFSDPNSLVTLALGASGPEFAGRTPEEAVQNAVAEWDVARHPDVQARISTHVGVGIVGSMNPLKRFSEALAAAGKPGLGDDTTYIHCVRLSDEELQMIIESGGKMSLAIPIAMTMGMGLPPVERIRQIDPEYRYSLSIDVQTNTAGDMFTKMRSLFQLQRALRTASDPELCNFVFFQDPAACRDGMITSLETLKSATIEGARANGTDQTTGTLEVGKAADVVVLKANAINAGPAGDPVGQVVQAMDTSNVESVLVAGKVVKENGELVGIDVPKLMREAENARDRILGG